MAEELKDEEQDLIDRLGTTLATPMRPEGGSLKTINGIEALEDHITNLVLQRRALM